MNPPSPVSAPVPAATDIDTMKGGLSDDTSNSPRTEMNFRKVSSSRNNATASANHDVRWSAASPSSEPEPSRFAAPLSAASPSPAPACFSPAGSRTCA